MSRLLLSTCLAKADPSLQEAEYVRHLLALTHPRLHVDFSGGTRDHASPLCPCYYNSTASLQQRHAHPFLAFAFSWACVAGVMVRCAKRWLLFFGLALLSLLTLFHTFGYPSQRAPSPIERLTRPSFFGPQFRWRDVPQRHPVQNFTSLPTGPLASIPKIQADFLEEQDAGRVLREQRLAAVKDAFLHSWEGYKSYAWLNDEVAPLTGRRKNDFGGWAATLVDSLDTLWIMGMQDGFDAAVSALRKIDFTTTQSLFVNVFETTIRYLGGLLSAYDISGQRYPLLLDKAIELGDMLYVAFDTPNRMPVTRWDWENGALGGEQISDSHTLVAEVGSMTLEFTRLSQLTRDDKYYDAISRVTNLLADWQNHTRAPGLWPVHVDTAKPDLHRDKTFTFGGMADSLYEYFPKQHLLLGGRSDQYQRMYHTAIQAAKERLFFRPLNPNNDEILLSGTAKQTSAGSGHFNAEGQHLTCFVGGMVALAARAFSRDSDLKTARQLTDGCVWAYESMPSGVMPEIFRAMPCGDGRYNNCTWNEQYWREELESQTSIYDIDGDSDHQAQNIIDSHNLPPGIISIKDPRYNLRPEAIESIFVLYRITGDESFREKAWSMFQSITTHTRTNIGYASISDVTEEKPSLFDSMESFWTAETLKYFYLIFSEPDHISLDDYVFNTEAHPLLRPK